MYKSTSFMLQHVHNIAQKWFQLVQNLEINLKKAGYTFEIY